MSSSIQDAMQGSTSVPTGYEGKTKTFTLFCHINGDDAPRVMATSRDTNYISECLRAVTRKMRDNGFAVTSRYRNNIQRHIIRDSGGRKHAEYYITIS